MKFQLSKEFKVGISVLLIAAAMYWLVFFLKGRNIFNRFHTYYAVYENVEGITDTGPIYIRGLKIGSINRISYNQEQNHFDACRPKHYICSRRISERTDIYKQQLPDAVLQSGNYG